MKPVAFSSSLLVTKRVAQLAPPPRPPRLELVQRHFPVPVRVERLHGRLRLIRAQPDGAQRASELRGVQRAAPVGVHLSEERGEVDFGPRRSLPRRQSRSLTHTHHPTRFNPIATPPPPFTRRAPACFTRCLAESPTRLRTVYRPGVCRVTLYMNRQSRQNNARAPTQPYGARVIK